MRIDERLRAGLERNAESFMPDVSLALEQVERRRSRALSFRPIIGIAAGLVTLTALTAIAQREADDSSTSPSVPTEPPALAAGRVFEAIVPPSPDHPTELNGRWQILFENGAIAIAPPQHAEGTTATRVTTVTGQELSVDLFGADLCSGQPPGRYHWSVAPWGDLNLAVLDDSCAVRTDLFTGRDRIWTAATPDPPPTSAPPPSGP